MIHHPLRTRGALASGAAVTGLALGAVLIGVAGSPASAEIATAARWTMNEDASATVMDDSGPYGLDGAIGDEVVTGGGHYEWTDVQPNMIPVTPGRLVTVDHDPILNPESEDFAIEFRYRTEENFGNILQKGQNATEGGYFKVEQPFGFVTCLFKDENGNDRSVQSSVSTSDGEWHTIRCELDRATGPNGTLWLYVDGELNQERTLPEALGRIANDWDFAIGGKIQCNQNTVECDYFEGELDDVEIGRSGLPTPPTTLPSEAPLSAANAATVGASAERGDRVPVGD